MPHRRASIHRPRPAALLLDALPDAGIQARAQAPPRGDVVNISRTLYRWARISRDAEVLASGDPDRIANRLKNKLLGRLLGRAGVWRFLWGAPKAKKD